MRLYVVISLLVCIPALANAQKFKMEERLVLDRDLNEWEEHLSDRQFNDERFCYMLDSNFIKSDIGLDLYKVKKKRIGPPLTIRNIGEKQDSMCVEIDFPDTILIGKTTYDEFFDYHSTGDSIRLVSLKDLREEFYPDVEGPCVYMINKFFIFNDTELYRLDRNFIHKMEMFYLNEISELKDMPPFAVIRVFTRTEHNRWWQFTGPWDWY